MTRHHHQYDTRPNRMQSSTPKTMEQLYSRPSREISSSRIKVVFKVREESDKTCLRQIYKPFLDIFDPNCDVLRFALDNNIDSGKWPLVLFGGCKDMERKEANGDLSMPPLSLILLLQEADITETDRLRHATQSLQVPPWKFHHSEWIATDRIQAYPQNSLDYFSIADDLPACSARQVHGTHEHLRILRYVQHDNWQESYNLYKVILMQEPDFDKPDFCIFTLSGDHNRTIQFALKRLPLGVEVTHPCPVILNFQVDDIAALLPLLPRGCLKVSKRRWQTRDIDGNDIYLEQSQRLRSPKRHRSSTKSRPQSRKSSSSSSSFADILLDTAQEFIAAEESLHSSEQDFSQSDDLDLPVWKTSTPKNVFDGQTASAEPTRGYPAQHPNTLRRKGHRLSSGCHSFTREHNRQSIDSLTSNSHRHTDSGYAEDKSDESEPRYRPFFARNGSSSSSRSNHSLLSDSSTSDSHDTLISHKLPNENGRLLTYKNGDTSSQMRSATTHLCSAGGNGFSLGRGSTSGAFKPYISDKPKGLNNVSSMRENDVRNIRATSGVVLKKAHTPSPGNVSNGNVDHERNKFNGDSGHKVFPPHGVGKQVACSDTNLEDLSDIDRDEDRTPMPENQHEDINNEHNHTQVRLNQTNLTQKKAPPTVCNNSQKQNGLSHAENITTRSQINGVKQNTNDKTARNHAEVVSFHDGSTFCPDDSFEECAIDCPENRGTPTAGQNQSASNGHTKHLKNHNVPNSNQNSVNKYEKAMIQIHKELPELKPKSNSTKSVSFAIDSAEDEISLANREVNGNLNNTQNSNGQCTVNESEETGFWI